MAPTHYIKATGELVHIILDNREGGIYVDGEQHGRRWHQWTDVKRRPAADIGRDNRSIHGEREPEREAR